MPLTVTSLLGRRYIPAPAREVDLKCDAVKNEIIENSSNFSTEFDLEKDGFYLLNIIATDRAGNQATQRIYRKISILIQSLLR